jgi:hypothetical protein
VQNYYSDAACMLFAGQTSLILNTCVEIINSQYAIYSAFVDSTTRTLNSTGVAYSDSLCSKMLSITHSTVSTTDCSARNNGYFITLPLQSYMPTTFSADGSQFM